MSYAFTKLASSITASSIWCEDNETRLLWITMLAMADSHGRVFGTPPGLARIANISVQGCRTALEKLAAPDPDSRSKDKEGRRIEAIDGGWSIVNHAKYRAMRDPEERRIQNRKAQAKWRSKRKPRISQSKPKSAVVSQGKPESAHTDTDTEYKGEGVAYATPPTSPLNGAQTIVYDRELQRLQKSMDALRRSYESHQTWSDDDRAKYAALKAERTRIRGLLGLTT